MLEPSELDMAQLRHDLRHAYQHLGYDGSVQALYEMLKGAEAFALIILEERAKEMGSSL